MNESILEKSKLKEVKKLFPDNECDLKFDLGRNPLHFAIKNPDIDVLIYLLKEVGLNPDKPSDTGMTPLHEAAFLGNLKAISLLIEMGADYNKKNILGQNIIGILNGEKRFDLIPEVKKIIKNAITNKGDKEETTERIDENVLRNRYDPSYFSNVNPRLGQTSQNNFSSDKEPLLKNNKKCS